MPLYAYECDNCGVRFERRQGFDDEPIRICPECEGKVHRLIQPAGVIFKGSGFYSTDHKSSSSTASSAAPKDKSTGENGAKSGSKTETAATKPSTTSSEN